MFFCCIYPTHLKSQSLKILSVFKPVCGVSTELFSCKTNSDASLKSPLKVNVTFSATHSQTQSLLSNKQHPSIYVNQINRIHTNGLQLCVAIKQLT